jgi:ABC-type uncharacterized transport system substrate-binding protein
VEGKSLILEFGQRETADELYKLAQGYEQKRVNVIVTFGGTETAIAKRATSEMAIVFMPAGDPVSSGFVNSMARPGTNLTGISYDRDIKIYARYLQVFSEVVPNLRRVVMLYDGREDPIATVTLPGIRTIAAQFLLKLAEKAVTSVAELEQEVSSLRKTETDGIFIICTSLFSRLKKTAAIAIARKIPLFACADINVVHEGALISYAPDLYQIGYRGGWYVDRILKGARPQDLPVETPRKFDLVINLKTAEAIGIRIPPEALQRADRVIK